MLAKCWKGALVGVVLGLVVGGCGASAGSDSSVGVTHAAKAQRTYHDATFLARDLKRELRKRFANDSSLAGVSVASVDCIAKNQAKTDFTCLAQYASDDASLSESDLRDTTEVTVSADGNSYITH